MASSTAFATSPFVVASSTCFIYGAFSSFVKFGSLPISSFAVFLSSAVARSCGAGVTSTNFAFTVMFLSIALFASNAGSHPTNLNPCFAVTFGASFARSANVLFSVLNT